MIRTILAALLASACTAGALPEPEAPSTLPAGDPCRLDGDLLAEAEQCGAACDAKPEAEREACRAECDKRINERCKQ